LEPHDRFFPAFLRPALDVFFAYCRFRGVMRIVDRAQQLVCAIKLPGDDCRLAAENRGNGPAEIGWVASGGRLLLCCRQPIPAAQPSMSPCRREARCLLDAEASLHPRIMMHMKFRVVPGRGGDLEGDLAPFPWNETIENSPRVEPAATDVATDSAEHRRRGGPRGSTPFDCRDCSADCAFSTCLLVPANWRPRDDRQRVPIHGRVRQVNRPRPSGRSRSRVELEVVLDVRSA